MTEEQTKLPLSGYAILKVYTTLHELRAKEPGEDVTEHDAMQFGWDWRWVEDKTFEVRITVAVEPSASRRQYAATNVVGRFRQVTESAQPAIGDFVKLQAVAILLPYARQYLTGLTANSVDGAFYLPTINVAALMHGFDTTKVTAARQEADLPEPKVARSSVGRSNKKK